MGLTPEERARLESCPLGQLTSRFRELQSDQRYARKLSKEAGHDLHEAKMILVRRLARECPGKLFLAADALAYRASSDGRGIEVFEVAVPTTPEPRADRDGRANP